MGQAAGCCCHLDEANEPPTVHSLTGSAPPRGTKLLMNNPSTYRQLMLEPDQSAPTIQHLEEGNGKIKDAKSLQQTVLANGTGSGNAGAALHPSVGSTLLPQVSEHESPSDKGGARQEEGGFSLFKCIGCCCCCTIPILVIVVLCVALGPSPPMPSSTTKDGLKPQSRTVFFDANEVAYNIPLAPLTYPESLQGILWFDQQGAYGQSEFPQSNLCQDAAMSFGDTEFSSLNEKTKEIMVSKSGPGWTWLNNQDAYQAYYKQGRLQNLLFQWNDDYTEARIWKTEHHNGKNYFGIGPSPSDFHRYLEQEWLVKNSPPAGACPPEDGAKTEARSSCAKWKRVKCKLWCFGQSLGLNKPIAHDVFELVDGKGNKVQPYHGEFVKFVQKHWNPSESASEEYKIDFSTVAFHVKTIFHGEYTEAASSE
eukprot:TRINITY_DN13564_c1_g2_i1.p1 TRINITY_DN13564_c1_g2~~TRINITY_DN13564_c1_g2_i1.p1  ORF type:complete len:423 (+),score=43.24 TRINITY_DN13564_c1_g2_i1:150-1418(+)